MKKFQCIKYVLGKMAVIKVSLNIYPFFTCNYRCEYCYLNTKDLTSLEKINIKLLDKFLYNNLREFKLNINILGGEPLLYPKYILSLVKILKNYKISGLNISTNAYIHLNNIHFKLLEKFDDIQVSLDAANPSTYQLIRGKNFEFVLSNIKVMIDHGFNVSLSFVANKLNIRELKDFVKLSLRLGVEKIHI